MVTFFLIAANVVVFFIELSQGSTNIDVFVRRWGLVPADLRQEPGALITLLSSTLLHAGWLHLIANMVYLGVFGLAVERRVGSARFAAIYAVSAIAGSLTYLVAQPASETPAIGASGAIAGVMAAVLFLHVIESTPTLLLLLLWLATQLFSSVAALTTVTVASTGIAWWAHLGGFASGLVLAPVLRKRRIAR